jgi:hypothetical protein
MPHLIGVAMNLHRAAAVCAFAFGCAAVPWASAQTDPGTFPNPVVQHTPAGIDYISGGVGEEDRAAMAARQAEFPLKIVLSAAEGEYIVADRVSVQTPQGELALVRDAGPILMMRLPPGQYTLEAAYKGKTQRRSLQVAGSAQTLNLRFAD